MSKYIKPYGNPNGSVFGKLGETLYTADGKIYYKADNDATNIGWIQTFPIEPTATATPTPTPTVTPIPVYVTPTPAPTVTPTPTPAPTSTPTPTATPTGPTPTPTATPTGPTPTPTATPVPVFKVASATLIGATYYNDANSLIIGFTMSGGTASISLAASWTRAATTEDPVVIKITGQPDATLTSTQTSYSTFYSLSSNTTFQFVRNSLTGDTGTLTVAKVSGVGNINNVSGRCLTTAYTAMDLFVLDITGTYDYNIRNCTTGINVPYTSVSNSSQAISSGITDPPAISFIEFVNAGAGFSSPLLSPVLP